MKYTKRDFGCELSTFLLSEDIEYPKIAEWAYLTKLKYVNDIDPEVDRWLEVLGTVDMGEEFELDVEELKSLISASESPQMLL